MRDIAIIGAGGHARDILCLLENINDDLQQEEQWNIVGFYDKKPTQSSMCGYPVYDEEELYDIKSMAVVCGIGTPLLRAKVVKKLQGKNPFLYFPTLISPRAAISKRAQIGKGTVIFQDALIMGGDIIIGDFSVVLPNSVVGHDCQLGDFAQMSPGCNIAGGTVMGTGAYLGIGVSVAPLIHIGEHAIIGTGSVVVSDIPSDCTAVGWPARAIKRNKTVWEI